MKVKMTRKEVLRRFKCVSVGYCELSSLLRFEEPIGYTSGIYGWNADIYYIGNGLAIVTGYRPFGNVFYREMAKCLEAEAREILYSNDNIQYKENKIDDLLDIFKNECII